MKKQRLAWIGAALSLCTWLAGAANVHAQGADARVAPSSGRTNQSTSPNASKAAPSATNQSSATSSRSADLSGLISCRTADMSALLVRLDSNEDGKVAKTEARSAANFAVGGFFFQADSNGDGVVTPEEGLDARKRLIERYPEWSALFSTVPKGAKNNPLAELAKMVDVEYGKPLRAEEARVAVGRAMDALYTSADRNKDGNLNAQELRNASWQAAQGLGAATFETADGNNDGALTLEEFSQALRGPAEVAFKLADRNGNGKLTQEEAGTAVNTIVGQFGMLASKQ